MIRSKREALTDADVEHQPRIGGDEVDEMAEPAIQQAPHDGVGRRVLAGVLARGIQRCARREPDRGRGRRAFTRRSVRAGMPHGSRHERDAGNGSVGGKGVRVACRAL